MVRCAGRYHQPRAALEFVRDVVNIRRPAHERVERRILHKNLGRRGGICGPFEINVPGVNPCVDQQRHDQIMARRVLRQDQLPVLSASDAQIIHAADFTAGDHTVPAPRPIDLLTNHRHRACVFHQLRSKQRDHVERAPQNMALAAGEKVAGLDRVIHDAQSNVETVLLRENALIVRLHAGIGQDDRRPARPDVDRELHYQLPVLR